MGRSEPASCKLQAASCKLQAASNDLGERRLSVNDFMPIINLGLPQSANPN
jgi:hypothetical protein